MKNIYFVFLFLLSCNECMFNHRNTIEYEIKRHFNEIMNSVNGTAELNIINEEEFPQTTSVLPSKVEIDFNDDAVFFITLNLNQVILPENITTEKENGYIKIDIKFDQAYYQIILTKDELFVNTESNFKVKNSSNTRYSQSSSRINRTEKLKKSIDLDSLKIKVDSKDKVIQIAAKYINNQKKSAIDIEFK